MALHKLGATLAIFETTAEQIREYVSRKALDIAETLPRFQRGRVYQMQHIRESNRKFADMHYENAKQPTDASIRLRSVTIVFCYELEQFASVHKAIKRAFPGNQSLIKLIDEIRKHETALNGASWYNLGTIARESDKHLLLNIIKYSELPENIERIHLSHHRILPSLASLEFKVIVSETFQETLRKTAERYYIPTSISTSLWPSKFFRAYSTSFTHGAENAVAHQLRKYVNEATSWLINDLHLNKKQIHVAAAHPLYQIEFSAEKGELVEYTKSQRAWLTKYGYEDTEFYGYFSDFVVFSPTEKQESFPQIQPLFFQIKESEQFWLHIDELLKGMACFSSLLSRLSVYRTSIESLRYKGSMELNKKWKIIRQSKETIHELKHLILRIQRLLSEFQTSKHWLVHSLEETASLKSAFANQQSTYLSNMLTYSESELQSLTNSAVMMDQALSERLATENIYVMYQLQRRVFWLTVVGVCIAAIGLIDTWDKIAPYAKQLIAIIK